MSDKARHILEICILDFLPSELMMLNFHVRTLLHTPFFIISVLGSGVSFSFLKAFSFAGDTAGSEVFWVYSAIASLWAATTLATGLIGYQRFQGTFPYLLLSPQGIPAVFVPLIVSAAFFGTCFGRSCVAFIWFPLVSSSRGSPGLFACNSSCNTCLCCVCSLSFCLISVDEKSFNLRRSYSYRCMAYLRNRSTTFKL